MPDVEKNMIMHVALKIGENFLMGTDIPASMEQATFGTNSSISVSVDSRPEADRIYNALSRGGKINMPMADMFWGAYYGMLTDRFGVQWMVNYDEKPAE